ncbi:MAG: peptidylprolyl isomerase [Acidobacteriia bacterium]|nr:peptidylprolyl isomerase [Terriglobia bacterium]
MRRVALFLCAAFLGVHAAAAPGDAGAAKASPKEGPVRAVLELAHQLYYAGDPLELRVSVGNEGDAEVQNPVKTPLPAGLEARVAGGALLARAAKPDASEPSRPGRLAPKYAYSAVIDLVKVFPELGKPGQYEIRWTADGVTSPTLSVRLIPKYDPAKEYRVRVETDEGSFSIEFFPKSAPLATKAFIDMANAGFYDGLTFHEIHSDQFVVGGDPQGDGMGNPPLRYPADPSNVPVVTGTILMKPLSPSPPTNGSQFIVMLRPEPTWTGQATVLGQVVDGIDVLQRISRLPSTQQTARPFFKPLKEVRIRKMTVGEKPAPH